RRSGVVEMDDRSLRANERLDGALDQILARLHEHLEPYVVRRALLLDQAAIEGEFCVGRRGKPDFDFFEPALHERLKKFEFLADVHGHSEGLVAVTEIDAAPARRLREDTVRPATVGQMDRRERAVF